MTKCSGLAGERAPVRTRIGGPWGSLGGSQGAPKAEVVLWERPGMVLGGPWVVLEVWGSPWVSPGRSECCYFVDFRWFSEMSCFLMFFHMCLKAMLFSCKTNHHMVFILIMGGQNVAISWLQV